MDLKAINPQIGKAQNLVEQMITNALLQKATNIGILFQLKHVLAEFSVVRGKNINLDLKSRWKVIMTWAPRVFEEHPLLDLLIEIDQRV